MAKAVTDFYDSLSPEYRDNMGWDWDAAVRKEGAELDNFILRETGWPARGSLLDCSCGIGTQAIGLAMQGYSVHATDLSTISIECAEQEAANLNVEMTFGIADFRNLEDSVTDSYDVVLTCDNSISHCLTDRDLDAALASMKKRLNPGGLLLISFRDYDALAVEKREFNSEHVEDRPGGRRIVFQVWDWAEDGRSYQNTQFLIKATGGNYDLKHFETELRVLLRDELIAAVNKAGFVQTTWHAPETSGYYQPIVTARNA